MFAVGENANGGLTIILPNDVQSSGSTRRITDHRFSIHESLETRDGGFTIKETVKRASGEIVHNFAYVAPNADTAMLHVFGQLPGREPEFVENAGQRTKARIEIFSGFWRGSIFYVVIVARSHFNIQWLAPLGVSLKEVQFKRYKLIVVAGIFRSIAFTSRITCTTMSMPSRINGELEYWIAPPLVPKYPISPLPEHIAWVTGELIDRLAESGKQAAQDCMWETGAKMSSTEVHKYFDFDNYYADPGEAFLTNRLLLRKLREANPPKGLWLPGKDTEFILVGRKRPSP